jgi:hypothetical protein
MLRCISQNLWFFFQPKDTKYAAKCKKIKKKIIDTRYSLLGSQFSMLGVVLELGCDMGDARFGIPDVGCEI